MVKPGRDFEGDIVLDGERFDTYDSRWSWLEGLGMQEEYRGD
jgi:hypothetical protein